MYGIVLIMKYTLLTVLVLAEISSVLTYPMYWNDEFVRWIPKYSNRTNMKCPNKTCTPDPLKHQWTREDCCVCRAKPLWEVPVDSTVRLQLEYVRRNGIAEVFSEEQNKSQYYSVYHSQGYLSKLPINICDFSNIVRIDLQSNELTEVGNLSCLSMLDILDLSYNKIHFIGNDSFLSLTNLRELRVTHNGLKTLAPSTLTSLPLFRADFSHNNMSSIEFSNMISESDFCKITFASNNISNIVNTNNFEIDPDKNYRGGIVDLVGNSFTTFIDFEKLGITDIAILGKVLSYGFVMPDVKWTCDCHMEPYLELAEDVIKRIWRDYFNISCWLPLEYRGKTIPDIVKEGRLDIFICNLTVEQKCPPKCKCFFQPKERRTVVDCSGVGLKELPPYVPSGNRFSNNLTLIFKDNNITHFGNRSYLTDATVLDMSGNKVSTFSHEAIEMLPDDIELNFADNNFKKVPRAFQTLNPCKSKFGDVTIDCGCDTEWVKTWADNRGLKQCSNMSSLVCETDSGLIPVDEISVDDICKQENIMITISIILSILSTLIMIIFGIVYLFRYEIYLLQRKYFLRNSASKVGFLLKYDAFVSFNDENDELRIWVLNVLVRHLEASGYRLFVPCRDLPPGSIKEEELLEQIINSRKYLIILCDYYQQNDITWTQIEWKYIWCHFRQYMERNIIVINFDQLETSEQTDPKLRAFVRLGYDIDFSNRKHDLFVTVKSRLGAPLKSLFFHGNKKTKFMAHNLITQKEFFDPFTVVDGTKINLEL